MRNPWTTARIPDLAGKVAVVTGANSGLGLETSRELARKGARVVMACRSRERGEGALARLRKQLPEAELEVRELDLASLDSVRSFAEGLLRDLPALHLLCNNAGVMALPLRHTADGFEMQIGTNHLGHFALTGLLIERLAEDGGGRVCTVSSILHRRGRIRLDDLNWERGYKKWPAYNQSKLANALFGFELHRRLAAAGIEVLSAVSHPGYSATNLPYAGPRMTGSVAGRVVSLLGNEFLAQSAARGALPSLRALADPDAEGGAFFGPDGGLQLSGDPVRVDPAPRAEDEETAARLWDLSVELTGVGFEALGR